MDVMEILTKLKCAGIAIVASLCCCSSFAQESKKVDGVKGEWIISNDITPVQARERAIGNLRLLTPTELRKQRDKLETWSQIVLDAWETL